MEPFSKIRHSKISLVRFDLLTLIFASTLRVVGSTGILGETLGSASDGNVVVVGIIPSLLL